MTSFLFVDSDKGKGGPGKPGCMLKGTRLNCHGAPLGSPRDGEAGEAECLAESRRIRGIFESFADEVKDWAVLSVNVEGRVADWNSGAERLTGYQASEILGRPLDVLFIPEETEQGRGGAGSGERQGAGAGVRLEEEGRVMRKDGSVFWARLITRPLRGEGGALCGTVRVVQDLTRRKGAEAGLRLYMELWENMPNGLLILHLENVAGQDTLKILAANPAVLQVLRKPGITVDELIDKTPGEVLPGLMKTDVSSSASAVAHLGKARKVGEVQYRERQSLESAFSIKAFPLPAQCVGILFEEITERKRMEEALRAAEARFRGLLEAAPDAMVITDRAGRIVLVNRAAELLFGYLREELEEQPLEILLPADARGKHLAATNAYFSERRIGWKGKRFPASGRRKDNSSFSAEISLGFWHGEKGVCAYNSIRER